MPSGNANAKSLPFAYETSFYLPQCLKILRYRELTKEKIAEELNLPIPHVLKILHKLECEKKVKRVNKKYHSTGVVS